MKKFFGLTAMMAVIIVIFVCFNGCKKANGEQTKTMTRLESLYQQAGIVKADVTIVEDWAVPDSLLQARIQWIKEIMTAASYHMSGGDYEDPEDVLKQAEATSNRLFSKPRHRELFFIYERVEGDRRPLELDGLPYDLLDKTQQEIFRIIKASKYGL